MRLGTPAAKTAFLFTRVGLAGCDMGACAMLPRIIGQGRAAELLYTGRTHERGGGRALGLLQSAGRGRTRSKPRRWRWRAALADGPDLRARHDQDHAESGMVDGARPGDRGGSAGAGDLHADAATSAAPTTPSSPRQKPRVRRAIEMADNAAISTGRSSRRATARWRGELERLGGRQSRRHRPSATSMPPAASWSRNSGEAAG